MKKNQFVKFSLTLVCAGVLAACHSSGNKDDDAKKRAQEQAQQQQQANDAAKKAAEEAAAQKAAEETAKTLQQKLAVTGDEGAKFVKKNTSNLVTNQVVEEANSRSSSSITGMTVPLYPSLDTIVVATPVGTDGKALQNAAQIYLEDFDFRGNDRDVATAAGTSGRYTLKHIYNVNAVEDDDEPKDAAEIGKTLDTGVARTAGYNNFTKTAKKGQDEGIAFVYENGRLNYTKRAEGGDVLDKRTARTEFQGNGYASTGRLDESVAEVYGYRTFVTGDSESGIDTGEYNVSNAPFVAAASILDANGANPSAADTGTKKVGGADADYTAGGKLNYVQYGRVTSQLDAVQIDDLEAGKNIVTLGTKIASYGGYGDRGTEDHYFYRGVNITPYSATLTSDLAAHYGHKSTVNGTTTVTPAGVLDYRGHAVTYGLDRALDLGDRVPNAIGYTHHLVSGTHATAQIDLASSAVNGRLYNVWHYSNGQESKDVTDNLANFNGTLANNGSIVGVSNKLAKDGKSVEASGSFVASLFGPKGEELGGTIASSDTYQNWGASFGAAVQNVGTSSSSTTPDHKPAIGESTDQGNVNNPNIGN